MRVLVTGSTGYIGSLLVPYLAARGHDVRGVDTGFFAAVGPFYAEPEALAKTVKKDVRRLTGEDLGDAEAIVHMAELSNDPLGDLAPQVVSSINHRGSVRLATLARDAGVARFVYMSSCSVYGVARGDHVTEESPTNPQTAYARCKVLVEQDVAKLAGDGFSPTFLRNATAFGGSPRMRFDLVLNNLAGLAWTTGEIRMTSDGTPWRPLVHVLDICKAIALVIESPVDPVHNLTLNVGDTHQNYRVSEIASTVSSVLGPCVLSLGDSNSDNRSYRVSFANIARCLPAFSCDWNAERGCRQLLDIFEHIGLSNETFLSRDFTRLKQVQYLLQSNQIDENFFWTD